MQTISKSIKSKSSIINADSEEFFNLNETFVYLNTDKGQAEIKEAEETPILKSSLSEMFKKIRNKLQLENA